MSRSKLGFCLKSLSLSAKQVQAASTSPPMSARPSIKYLNQQEAISLDQELFEEFGFSVDQLMELAGLSCAQVVAKCYPVERYSRPVILAGPGNNGGDGLVCARHLKMFGYSPTVICPKPGRSKLYQNLIKQCRKNQVVVEEQASIADSLDKLASGNLQIDALFGFSFKPPNRNETFAKLLQAMHSSRVPIVSIDIPSGWDVDTGDRELDKSQQDLDESLKIPKLKPDCLISLTAPKLCALSFSGLHHYLAGRFVPESIANKYKLNLPAYPDCQGILSLYS